ncbi:hypothetical protein LZ30DRAFT_712177 [Colletotrichum cereale]|nr:hypothetical protein LZ30DRAFT_712177 [Colletotrichum cereale]
MFRWLSTPCGRSSRGACRRGPWAWLTRENVITMGDGSSRVPPVSGIPRWATREILRGTYIHGKTRVRRRSSPGTDSQRMRHPSLDNETDDKDGARTSRESKQEEKDETPGSGNGNGSEMSEWLNDQSAACKSPFGRPVVGTCQIQTQDGGGDVRESNSARHASVRQESDSV